MENLYDKKINNISSTIARLEVERDELKAKKEAIKGNSNITKWIDYPFASSSSTTSEFREFEKDFIEGVKKQVGNEFKLYGFGGSHFYVSGFLKNKKTGKIVYISVSDVRFFPNGWYEDVLIRTAKDEKDYTGGRNNSCNFYEIYEKAKELTE